MFMSGAKIGMVAIVALLRPILLVQSVGRAVCSVAAVGAVRPGSVVLRTVTTALQTAATSI